MKPVYAAVAIHTGHKAETIDGLYSNAFAGFKQQMSGTLANKLICERFKARSLMLIERAFTTKVDFSDRVALKNSLLAEIPQTQPVASPRDIWDAEEAMVNAALESNDITSFLKTLPGKLLIGPVATSLGLTKERYCELVKIGLGSFSDPGFLTLHTALEAALKPYLPPRRASQPE